MEFAASMIDAWRARRAHLRAQRIRASAQPRPKPAPISVLDLDEEFDECAAALDDLLKRWHRWQMGFSPVPVCGADPMFRNVKASRTFDTTSDAFDAELNGRLMEAVDFQVSEMPDEPNPGGRNGAYRSAIYCLAKNLALGASVWDSPRLPKDQMERAIVVLEARNILTRRLLAAGGM
ncbi:MAG: hypothetical protein GAK28_04765 [Luteibacter sp.]|uniref:hypothetical protein n=1 Tax=Luteibacter sp. TaxID=1886636 RepID=UPI00138228E4|nr:hypothetical protein [Luteibacter sp.]KAF1003326.1 MAG: hypothetical protein GAK28_04765 [Luteibacter sp.]